MSHKAKCNMCRRNLSNPESCWRGLGADCAEKFRAYLAQNGASHLAESSDKEVNRKLQFTVAALSAENGKDALSFLEGAKRAAANVAPVREIVIEQTPRGHRVVFPFKPSDNAIRGFHQAKMTWQKGESGVYWTIPSGALDNALDVIRYWFEQDKGDRTNRHNCAPYTVRVAEAAERMAA